MLPGCTSVAPGDGTHSSPESTERAEILDGREPPSRDELIRAGRPPAKRPTTSDPSTVEPIPYPERPNSYTESSIQNFVESYEEAYRRNLLLGEYGGSLIDQGTYVDWTYVFDVTESAGVARLQYTYSVSQRQNGRVVVSDSNSYLVTYYVDDSMVVRAQVEDSAAQRDILEPDPWEDGKILEPA